MRDGKIRGLKYYLEFSEDWMDRARQKRKKARRKKVDIITLPTVDAIETLVKKPKNTNAVLHVTC